MIAGESLRFIYDLWVILLPITRHAAVTMLTESRFLLIRVRRTPEPLQQVPDP